MLKKDQIEFIKKLYSSLSDTPSDGESTSELSKVLLKGIKDTELPETSQITNQDIISLVQNGENKTISYSDLKKEMADIAELSDISVDYGVSASLSTIPTAYVSSVSSLGTLTSLYLWTRIKYIFQSGSSKYIHIPVYMAKDGEKGDTGNPGQDGLPGVSTKSPSQRMIFISKPEGTVPTKPANKTGYWNTDTNTFTPPAGWSASNEGMSPVVWFSTGNMLPMGTVDDQGWSEPSRITGEKGEDGKDSASAEYIYCLTVDTKQLPPDPDNNADVDDYIPENWSDHPNGISEQYKCEWVCTRTKDPDTGKWGNFSEPRRWATWGIDGTDGDGVEYIFCRTDVGSKPVCPVDNKDEDEYLPTDALVDAEGNSLDINGLSGGWTDDPADITSTYRWLWCTKRKFVDGHWGPWGNGTSWVALWGVYGEEGNVGPEGNHTEYRYCSTDDSSTVPTVNKTDKNPGSAWGTSIPTDVTKVIWAIEAVFKATGDLVGEWSNPYIKSGIKGETGTAPNYSNIAYIKAATKPDKPSNNSAKYPSGWVEYPTSTDDDEGRWWQCTAIIQGSSNPEIALSWGEVGPVFGHDGDALTGDTYEERFTYWNDNTESNRPPVAATSNNPGDRWTLLSPKHISGESEDDYIYVWKVIAKIDAQGIPITQQVEVNGSYESRKWGIPFCISGARGPVGETGPAGEKGPNGIAGTPGVSFKVLTCLGTATAPNPSAQSITAGSKVVNPTGWYLPKDCPDPTTNSTYPYVWYIQCHVIYETQEDINNDNYTIEDGWSTPARLSGIQGIQGEKGEGQLIYPAGIYSEDKTYTCDSRKAPYVFVPGAGSDGKGAFYVMNYIGTWNGKEQGQTIIQATANGNTKWWVEFEGFEAIYTDILIAQQSLIGSAVFDTHGFMFSQQGKNADGETTNKYQYFNPLNKSNPYDYTEEELATEVEDGNIFYPSFCLNFLTGEAWYCGGNVVLSNLTKFITETTTPDTSTVHFLTNENAYGERYGLTVFNNLLKFRSGDYGSGIDMLVSPEAFDVRGRVLSNSSQYINTLLHLYKDGSGNLLDGAASWNSKGVITLQPSDLIQDTDYVVLPRVLAGARIQCLLPVTQYIKYYNVVIPTGVSGSFYKASSGSTVDISGTVKIGSNTPGLLAVIGTNVEDDEHWDITFIEANNSSLYYSQLSDDQTTLVLTLSESTLVAKTGSIASISGNCAGNYIRFYSSNTSLPVKLYVGSTVYTESNSVINVSDQFGLIPITLTLDASSTSTSLSGYIRIEVSTTNTFATDSTKSISINTSVITETSRYLELAVTMDYYNETGVSNLYIERALNIQNVSDSFQDFQDITVMIGDYSSIDQHGDLDPVDREGGIDEVITDDSEFYIATENINLGSTTATSIEDIREAFNNALSGKVIQISSDSQSLDGSWFSIYQGAYDLFYTRDDDSTNTLYMAPSKLNVNDYRHGYTDAWGNAMFGQSLYKDLTQFTITSDRIIATAGITIVPIDESVELFSIDTRSQTGLEGESYGTMIIHGRLNYRPCYHTTSGAKKFFSCIISTTGTLKYVDTSGNEITTTKIYDFSFSASNDTLSSNSFFVNVGNINNFSYTISNMEILWNWEK